MQEDIVDAAQKTPDGIISVSSELTEFYSDWYSDSKSPWETKKRSIAAVDSVSHIKQLAGAKLGHIVDVGAGGGVVLQQLSKENMFESATALEISPSGCAAIASRQITGVNRIEQFDGYNTSCKTKEFDTAICIHVIEHVEHERQFIRELSRIAKRVFIEVPLEGGLRSRVNRLYGHINYYTPPYFLNLLETSGMKPLTWKVVASSRDYEAHLYGKVKGPLKYAIRRGILEIAGENLAPHLTTFMFSVLCEGASE